MNYFAYLVLILGLLAGPAKAEEYTFSTFPFEPWSFIQNNKVIGIMPDVAKAIATEAGLTITIEILPYARMVKNLQQGGTDFAIFARDPSNDSFVNYIDPIFVLKVILLTRKGMPISTLENFYGQNDIYSTGVIRGANLYPKLTNDEKVSKYQVKDITQGLRMLNSKRIDALVTIDTAALYESRKLGLSERFKFPGYPLNKIEAWIQVSKQSRHAKSFPYEAVSMAAKKLTDKGVIEEILKKYLGDTSILNQDKKLGLK